MGTWLFVKQVSTYFTKSCLFLCKVRNYHSLAEQNSENMHGSSGSAANLFRILIRYICTVKHIQEIIRILR